MKSSIWYSSIRLYLISILYFAMAAIYWQHRAPNYTITMLTFLAISIAGAALLANCKKSSDNVIGWFYLSQIFLILCTIVMNHQYYVENFERFQPYLGIKLLVFIIALSAQPVTWVAVVVFAACAVIPMAQFYTWPTVYQNQLGMLEPAATVFFVISAAVLYTFRIHTQKLEKKQISAAERIAIYQRLGSIMQGLQHLNNTPLQTIEISLQLLRANFPDAKPILEPMERSYISILRVNQLLSAGGSVMSGKSPSTIDEFANEVREIGKYLKAN